MELRGLGESFVRNGSCTERCSVPNFPGLDLSPWHWLHPFLPESFCFDGSVSLVLHSVQEDVRMQSALLAPLITTLSFIPLRTKMGKPFLWDLYKVTFFTLHILLFLIYVMPSSRSMCRLQMGRFLAAVYQITDFWGGKSTCESWESPLLTYMGKCIDHLGFNVSFLCKAVFQVNGLAFLILVTCGIYCVFHSPGWQFFKGHEKWSYSFKLTQILWSSMLLTIYFTRILRH